MRSTAAIRLRSTLTDRDELKSWTERELPARQLGQPDDLADAALFLMTNPYITEQTVLIDGGITAI